MMTGSYVRHHAVMANGIPEPYRSMRNPLSNTAATLEQGARIYQQDCSACHGPQGEGDGPAGKQLKPPAANLASLSHMPMGQSDAYLYWTIAEGGQQFGTAMPSFKGALSPNDRWAVVDYLRQGLPQNTRQK
jgi:mono/diheme cytochrome c family protein